MILIPALLAVKYYRQTEALAAQIAAPNPVFEPDVRSGDAQSGATDSESADSADPETVEPSDAPESKPSDSDREDAGEDPAITLPEAADPPSYQLLYEDFYAPQPYCASERVENTIYLTFDDGPSDRTDEILRILDEKNVKATFFVTGKSDPEDLARMKKIVDAGHTIGMHSYSHDYSSVYGSVESFLDEFHRNFLQIIEATGVTPTVFRFPGGSINGYDGGFYQEILSEMIRRGFVPYDWNISSEDAASSRITPSEKLAANVARGAQGKVRGFVLFHDSSQKTTTPQAVSLAIDQLRAMGFDFAPITPTTLPVLYNYHS